MDTTVNNQNSAGDTVATQTGSTGSNPDDVTDALRQLQATLSGFVQQAQAIQEASSR